MIIPYDHNVTKCTGVFMAGTFTDNYRTFIQEGIQKGVNGSKLKKAIQGPEGAAFIVDDDEINGQLNNMLSHLGSTMVSSVKLLCT